MALNEDLLQTIIEGQRMIVSEQQDIKNDHKNDIINILNKTVNSDKFMNKLANVMANRFNLHDRASTTMQDLTSPAVEQISSLSNITHIDDYDSFSKISCDLEKAINLCNIITNEINYFKNQIRTGGITFNKNPSPKSKGNHPLKKGDENKNYKTANTINVKSDETIKKSNHELNIIQSANIRSPNLRSSDTLASNTINNTADLLNIENSAANLPTAKAALSYDKFIQNQDRLILIPVENNQIVKVQKIRDKHNFSTVPINRKMIICPSNPELRDDIKNLDVRTILVENLNIKFKIINVPNINIHDLFSELKNANPDINFAFIEKIYQVKGEHNTYYNANIYVNIKSSDYLKNYNKIYLFGSRLNIFEVVQLTQCTNCWSYDHTRTKCNNQAKCKKCDKQINDHSLINCINFCEPCDINGLTPIISLDHILVLQQ